MKRKNSLAERKNIGPKILSRLQLVGISTLADLKRVGPVKAYLMIRSELADQTIPKCYYLYSLEGAIRNVDWRTIPESTKKKLLSSLESS